MTGNDLWGPAHDTWMENLQENLKAHPMKRNKFREWREDHGDSIVLLLIIAMLVTPMVILAVRA